MTTQIMSFLGRRQTNRLSKTNLKDVKSVKIFDPSVGIIYKNQLLNFKKFQKID